MPQPFADELHDGADSAHGTGRWSARWREFVWVTGLITVIAVGIWIRTLPAGQLLPPGFRLVGWRQTTTINVYFADGAYLFPVSRRLPTSDQLPRVALEALLAGPGRSGKLRSATPPNVDIRSFSVTDGIARIDLSRGLGAGDAERMALAAITETMTGVPGVTAVVVSVQGQSVGEGASRTPLLYFPSADGLVAVPHNSADARAALSAYLSGPPTSETTGIPSDVRLISYNYDAGDRLLSIGFTYTSSLRTLALEKPDRTRMLLLGLIASLTEFPDVRAVRLDFGGQSRLGLGECSDLLRSPQPRPALLNDERLLPQ
jgi:spore germination protein GerM